MRRLAATLVVVGSILIPTLAFSQTTLAGTVRDTSGAVLPGVTVEAASPALIEKVRSAVTDNSGQYRITDLAPGSYTVTYSLTGFTRVVREDDAGFGSAVTAGEIDRRVFGKLLQQRNHGELRKRPGVRRADEYLDARVLKLFGDQIGLRLTIDQG